jgi:hypothetical protein
VADTRLTFIDFQKQLDPSGKNLLPVAEVLNQINAPLQDGPITPSNADLGHRVTFRSGLPTVATGKMNKGVPRSKSTTEQRTESMALFVGRSEIDVKNRIAWGESKFNMKRAGEDIAFAEAFSQYIAQQFIYGTIATDEATFDGLATRMPSLQQPAPGQQRLAGVEHGLGRRRRRHVDLHRRLERRPRGATGSTRRRAPPAG